MKLKQPFSALCKALFHKRNIIIMSERSTSHVSMSGKIQFLLFFVLVSVIGTASFSTGKYMSAKQVINDQDKTIKSVANSRIEDSYSYGVPSLSGAYDGSQLAQDEVLAATPMTDSAYHFSTLDENKLVARIALLESSLREVNETNQEFIDTVRKTADGQIEGLEEVISESGLSPDTLKRHAMQERKIRRKAHAGLGTDNDGKGGPYIPKGWNSNMQQLVEDINASADDLYVLRKILQIMPTAKPMKNARYTSSFGHRRDPFTRRVAFHSGMDLASKTTPQIIATSDGVVSFSGRRGAYGNMVEIKHGLGLSTRYAHLSRIFVKPGDTIKQGQVVGLQGSTGRSTGAHLHYEVRFNNRPLDPRGFVKAGEAYVQQQN